MPLFLIERNCAEQLEVTPESAAGVKLINDEIGVNWLFSFLSATRRRRPTASTRRRRRRQCAKPRAASA